MTRIIFEKFGQVVGNGRSTGTGLGLTFCKMAVEAHGGTIMVISEENKGAEFIFTLPISNTEVIEYIAEPVKDEEDLVQLTAEDKLKLMHLIPELKKYDVYQISFLKKIINQIPVAENVRIKSWKSQIEKAVNSVNEQLYENLLDLAIL